MTGGRSGALVVQGDARHLPLPDASVDLMKDTLRRLGRLETAGRCGG